LQSLPPAHHAQASEQAFVIFVVSGKMATGDIIMTAGDYIYEPAGVMHEAPTAFEDTVQLFISLGAIARLDDAGGITGVITWQDIESLRQSQVNNT
jgi:uncharacterized RmlC-like cupin family protein